ncbi:MAG: hypothetical protein JJU02_12050 [Cryomorphaceae bacterium]|nr:hypothetical protein [Cryomorphaceae bacterium]
MIEIILFEVVSSIDFYNNSFYQPESDKALNPDQYGSLKSRIENFIWEYRQGEMPLDNSDFGKPEDYALEQEYKTTPNGLEKLLKNTTAR